MRNSIPIYRAWRFKHPDFDTVADDAGIGISSTGGIAMVAENESVRQAILLLLTTKPGERVMRPEYGCDLHNLVFAPNDATTHGLAIHYVREALQTWEPRIDIIHLDAGANVENPGCMDIHLQYRVRRTAHQNHLALTVPLTAEER